mmetsp:Transcript_86631/g.171989  ORF Transcript_86631/g.171989 Transcript_86631/m.171989 type:complete len:209 (-) Transcript_86631:565-1191(-)
MGACVTDPEPQRSNRVESDVGTTSDIAVAVVDPVTAFSCKHHGPYYLAPCGLSMLGLKSGGPCRVLLRCAWNCKPPGVPMFKGLPALDFAAGRCHQDDSEASVVVRRSSKVKDPPTRIVVRTLSMWSCNSISSTGTLLVNIANKDRKPMSWKAPLKPRRRELRVSPEVIEALELRAPLFLGVPAKGVPGPLACLRGKSAGSEINTGTA